jgi:nitroreductase
MDLIEAIKTRRSIRRYTPDPVDDAKIEAILEAGRWAPSWANTQCWRFIVVRDPEIKARVAGTLKKMEYKGELADNRLIAVINTVPVLIVICAEEGKSGKKPWAGGGEGDFFTDRGDFFMFDTALAVQNMVLAAHTLGLGTVITGTFDARQVEETLGVPEGYRVVVIIPVGVPQPVSEAKIPPRKELAEIVLKDRWVKS